MTMFWVMKKLMGRTMWEKQELGEDKEHLGKWREKMKDELKMLEQNMDAIM